MDDSYKMRQPPQKIFSRVLVSLCQFLWLGDKTILHDESETLYRLVTE